MISADPGASSREDRKLYYKAIGYNGFGDDMTSLVVVENLDQVDDTTLNEATSLNISVDDKTVRGLSECRNDPYPKSKNFRCFSSYPQLSI